MINQKLSYNKVDTKQYNNIFKLFSFWIAIFITARIFIPAVNIIISGLIYNVIFIIWLCVSLLAYKETFRINKSEVFLYSFPAIFVMYIIFCNATAFGGIYIDDFIVFFNFCIPIYMYLIYSKCDKRVLYKLSVAAFVFMSITSIATIYNLEKNYYYSKLLTATNVDTYELWIKNIANINFISSCIILIPFLFYVILKTNKSKRVKILIGFVIMLYSIMVFKASFSIITLCVLLGVVLVIFSNKYMLIVNVIILLICFGLKNDISAFLINISYYFNELYSQRLVEIALFIKGQAAQGDFLERINVYNKSIQYFFQHPFLGLATGEYFNRNNILGYHSEFFDSLARYGLIMFLPIVYYFKDIFNKILSNLHDKKYKKIIYISILLFIIYSFMNILFISYMYSFALFIVAPSIEFFIDKKERINENFNIIKR